ncbi:hypothetical protein SAMN05444483_10279 [Salegentibacter echinorum]|uniref:Uncharacterized protein n=1 Tax=Salegentibacter echinorum TaxID=1073325 RepID=A0A1M5DRH1_SALEC|nr:hypothetical protein [Salegentibacter echinorum]SHF69516.1 hypothetical protein SAMN05444483_10279 [Salegentibacter echinorum]
MNDIDYLLIVSISLIVLTFITILAYGKKTVKVKSDKKLFFKIVPLVAVVSTVVSVFLMDYYYQNNLESEIKKYRSYLTADLDSIPSSDFERKKALDSLTSLNSRLNQLLKKIERQEKIIGEKEGIKTEVRNSIKSTSLSIDKIETYNEISEEFENLENIKGHTSSGNTSNFEFHCPTDSVSDYVDLVLKINDNKLVDKIAYIYITVTEKRNDSLFFREFDQAYLPQKGLNAFRIKNYLKKPNRTLKIGYFLKNQMNKEYPRYEKVSCNSY